jgi:hypothetical protein
LARQLFTDTQSSLVLEELIGKFMSGAMAK